MKDPIHASVRRSYNISRSASCDINPSNCTKADAAIPAVFSNFGFVLLKKGQKIPIERDWQNKPRDYDQASQHIQKCGNVGIIIKYPYGLLDQDAPDAFQDVRLPKTTCWETRPCRTVYLLRWTESEAEIAQILQGLGKRPDIAQIKLFRNGAHVGELKLQRTYQVIPPSWKSLDGVRVDYRMLQDVPPATVSLRCLVDELQRLGISFSEKARLEESVRRLEEIRTESRRRTRDAITKAEEFLQRAIDKSSNGDRNDTGFWLAQQLRDLGLSPEAASEYMIRYQQAVKDLAAPNGDKHEYTLAEAIKSLESAYSRASRDPPACPGIEGISVDSITSPENPRLTVDLEPDNLISLYIKYGKTSCDAYQEYHYAGGLILLSVVTNRNLVLRLAQGDVFPNIWAFLLGRSTISRKSAAVNMCERILQAVSPDNALPQSYSPEGLIEELSDKPRGYLIKDEAGAMLAAMQKNYMLEMRDLYCILYDNQSYKRKLRSGQRKERREFGITNPFVNILTATTPHTFHEYTQMLDLTSGWLLRFLYFYPNHKKEWMAFRPAGDEEFELYGAIIGRLMKLKSIFFNRTEPLEIKLSREAWDYYQAWQRQREFEFQSMTDDILLAFWGRLSFYALKLAMLFTIGRVDYSEGVEVSLKHVQEACRQVDEYFMPMARIVAEEVAREETKNVQNRIIGLLKNAGGKMKQRDLLRKLHITMREYEEACTALEASEEIARVKDGCMWVVLTSSNFGVTSVTNVPMSQMSHEFNDCHGNFWDTCDTGTLVTVVTPSTQTCAEEQHTPTPGAVPEPTHPPECLESQPATEPPTTEELRSELVRRGEISESDVQVIESMRSLGDHGAPAFELSQKLKRPPSEIVASLKKLAALGLVRNRGRDPKEPHDGDHWVVVGGD